VWAIVLAILFFPIGLLFLCARTNVTTGWLEVNVRTERVNATTQAVAGNQARMLAIRQSFARADR
jgi:hypothetical protein